MFSMDRIGLSTDTKYTLFLIVSTLFIYALHKYVGIGKLEKEDQKGRYAIIEKYKNHILIYSILSFCAVLYYYLNFDWNRKLLLLIPGVISITYTIPIFLKRKRLRDFSYIKIFLIAIVWALVSESIPMYENGYSNGIIALLFLERFLFFIAITIPFDIRDLMIDSQNDVQTIPSILGIHKSIHLATYCLLLCIAIEGILLGSSSVQLSGSLSLIITYTIALVFIRANKNYKNDHLFTGIIDGFIGLPYIIYLGISIF